MIAASSGIAFSAIRLPHVYGAMDLYFQQIRQGLLILTGLGKNIFSHLHVADTAKLLIACAKQGFCGILPMGDDLPATWSEFLALVRGHHAGARVLVLPEWLALAAAYAIAPVRRFRPHPGLETPGAIRSQTVSKKAPGCGAQISGREAYLTRAAAISRLTAGQRMDFLQDRYLRYLKVRTAVMPPSTEMI
jgi:hypothetical protein